MSILTTRRKLSWDWYDGTIPQNVSVDESAYVETTYSFLLYRSELPQGLHIGRGSTTYLGTMFDVGPRGRVTIGDFSLIHGAWFICDSQIDVGDYTLISWNVVFMVMGRRLAAVLIVASQDVECWSGGNRGPASPERRTSSRHRSRIAPGERDP